MIINGIQVVGYHQETNALKAITFYHIQVKIGETSTYVISKRFSEVLKLHRKLAQHSSLFALPPKPPKYPTRLIQNEEFIRKRINDLNYYFRDLLRVDLVTSHDGFVRFFAQSDVNQ